MKGFHAFVKNGVFAAIVLGVSGCYVADPKMISLPKPVEKPTSTKAEISFFPGLDILFVVDDSGSMYSHQENLSNNVALFVNRIMRASVIDYHIGVTTTSVGTYWGGNGLDGKLKGPPIYVDRSTPDGLKALQKNLMVGIDGSATEMAFRPVVLALSNPHLTGHNAGFYRQDAHLAVVLITDAEDQSDSSIGPQDLYDFLVNLKNGREHLISTYAVIVPSTDSRCPRDGGVNDKPVRIEEFIRISHGRSFGLCDYAYGKKLAQLGRDLYSKVMRPVYLEQIPVPGSIEVVYGSQVIPEDPMLGWTYDPVAVAIRLGPDLVWSEQPKGTSLDIRFVPIKTNTSTPKD